MSHVVQCSNNPPPSTDTSQLIRLGIQIVQAVRFCTCAGMYDGVHRYSIICQGKHQSDRPLFSRVFCYVSQSTDGRNICSEEKSIGAAFDGSGFIGCGKR